MPCMTYFIVEFEGAVACPQQSKPFVKISQKRMEFAFFMLKSA